MPLHPLLRRFLESRDPVLVYGPAATGKTRLALEFYWEAARLGYEPVLVATEPGTVTVAEEVGVPYTPVLTLDELVRVLAEEAAKGRYLIVDSVNFHYRGGAWPENARLLALSSSLVYEVGGFATAQVSGEGRPSGEPYIMPWARVAARTRRGPGGLFIVEVLRPVERTLAFRLEAGRVRWL